MTKAIKTACIFLLFFLTWGGLFWITGSRTPWQVLTRPSGEEGIAVSLGDVPAQPYDRMGFTGGFIRALPDGTWIVGSDRGDLFHFDRNGKELWKRSLGDGAISAMEVSRDGQILYVGEKSRTGLLYALKAESGDILWQAEAAAYVGSDPSARSDPYAVHISADKEGNVYVNFHRFTVSRKALRGYIAKIASFSPDGKERWRYPEEGTMDAWTNWNDVNDENGLLLASTASNEMGQHIRYDQTLYLLDKDTGRLTGKVLIPPVEGFANTVMRGSPNFSPDGTHMAGAASDGRGFLFDKEGKILWTRDLSLPVMAGGMWMNAAGREARILPEGVAFTTINTFNRENWQLPTPVIHPGSNSLFLFALDGTFLFRYTAKGEIEDAAFAPGVAAVAVGRNVRTHDYTVHGASAVSLTDGRELSHYHTEGPVQVVAISADGKEIAAIEAPAVTPDGKLIGSYTFHLWDRK